MSVHFRPGDLGSDQALPASQVDSGTWTRRAGAQVRDCGHHQTICFRDYEVWQPIADLVDTLPQGNQPTSDIVVTGTGVSNSANPFILNVGTISGNNVEITLDNMSRLHIFARHVWRPLNNTSRYLSQFANTNAINMLFQLTVDSTIGFPQPNGNYYFSADLGFPVGTDQVGLSTSWNTVIVRLLEEPTQTTPGWRTRVSWFLGTVFVRCNQR